MALDSRHRSLSSASPLPAQTVPVQGYLRRYVCRSIGAERPSCFSVGVRDPFEGHDTPVWLRFHKGTPLFSMIRDHLRASDLTLVEKNDGHVWIPLDVQLNADRNAVVASLVAQAERIFTIARGTPAT